MTTDSRIPVDEVTPIEVTDPSRIWDAEMMVQFVRDLRAANRLKSYLLASGAELPDKLTSELAALSARTLGKSEDPHDARGAC